MRARIALAALALLTTVAAATFVPAGSYAAGSGTVVVKDRVGDVSMPRLKRTHVFHLTPAQKQSIDIKQVSFQPVGGNVRITVALRQVLRSRAFDQVVHVAWRETSGTRPLTGDVFADSRRWRAGATYGDPEGNYFARCSVRSAVSNRYNTLSMTVPYACVPVGPLNISVDTLTGKAESDAPVPSRDSVRVTGRPVFDPA